MEDHTSLGPGMVKRYHVRLAPDEHKYPVRVTSRGKSAARMITRARIV
ncbi:MAG TPA: hypothetical protein VFB58_02090 [Chloroflexota bacterium]|nr:hypothetical protein [Chloroflexota bacterium]